MRNKNQNLGGSRGRRWYAYLWHEWTVESGVQLLDRAISACPASEADPGEETDVAPGNEPAGTPELVEINSRENAQVARPSFGASVGMVATTAGAEVLMDRGPRHRRCRNHR
jgi:hypothetical protein